MFDLRQDNKLS